MKTIKQMLEEADPLKHEPAISASQRELRRRSVAVAASTVSATALRYGLARAVTIILAGIAVLFLGGRIWPRMGFESYAAVRFEIRLAEDNPGAGLREIKVEGSNQPIYLHSEVILSNGDIARAEVLPGNGPDHFSVGVEFTPEGAQKVRAATQSHLGKRLAILIDDQIVMAPVVKAPIGSSAVITGDLRRGEAQRIVDGIVGK